jgi:hypothetical protein
MAENEKPPLNILNVVVDKKDANDWLFTVYKGKKIFCHF